MSKEKDAFSNHEQSFDQEGLREIANERYKELANEREKTIEKKKISTAYAMKPSNKPPAKRSHIK